MRSLRVLAIGRQSFVAGFQLAGVEGRVVESPEEALRLINRLAEEGEVGLILLCNELARGIEKELAQLRSNRALPLIYELPSPGGKMEKIEYKELLRQVLGV